MRETDTSTSAKSKTDRQLIATTGIWVGTGFVLLAALIAFAVAMSGTWSTGVMCVLMSLGICLSVLAGTAASISVQLALARGARHRADRRGVDLLAGFQGIAQDLRDSWADDLAEMRKQHEAAIGVIDERHRVLLGNLAALDRAVVDAVERTGDAAKWKQIIEELKQGFGPGSDGSVVSIEDRRNGHARPGA